MSAHISGRDGAAAPDAVRIGLETGPLTTWLWSELSKRRVPLVCLDARRAQRALDMLANKTDASDADGVVLPSLMFAMRRTLPAGPRDRKPAMP